MTDISHLIRQELSRMEERFGLPFRELKLSRRFLDRLRRHYAACSMTREFFDSEPEFDRSPYGKEYWNNPDYQAAYLAAWEADTERRLSFNNWIDLYEEGVWGLTQGQTEKLIYDLLEELRKRPVSKHGRLWYAEGDGYVYIHWFGRDLTGEDLTWYFIPPAEKRAMHEEVLAANARTRRKEKHFEETKQRIREENADWSPEDALDPAVYRRFSSRHELFKWADAQRFHAQVELRGCNMYLLMRINGRVEPINIFDGRWYKSYDEARISMELRAMDEEELGREGIYDGDTPEEIEETRALNRIHYRDGIFCRVMLAVPREPWLLGETELLAILDESQMTDWMLRAMLLREEEYGEDWQNEVLCTEDYWFYG